MRVPKRHSGNKILTHMASPNNRPKDTKFSKFLIMKHRDLSKNMNEQDPFEIHQGLTDVLGKKYKAKPVRSGHLLV